MKNSTPFFLIFLICFSGCIVSYNLFGEIQNRLTESNDRDENFWKEYTSPLPLEVKEDLCKEFELPSEDRFCDLGEDVYGGDFYPLFHRKFPLPGYYR